MKHLVYLLALVLALTACNNINSTTKELDIKEPEWKKYESSQYGFSFSYPPDWILEENGDTVQVHSLEQELYLYDEYLDIKVVSSSFDDLRSEIENSDRISDGSSLAQFSEPTEVNINGIKSLTGEHATAIGAPVSFYYIPFGGNGLWITRYNGFDEVEEKVIGTFRVKEEE